MPEGIAVRKNKIIIIMLQKVVLKNTETLFLKKTQTSTFSHFQGNFLRRKSQEQSE